MVSWYEHLVPKGLHNYKFNVEIIYEKHIWYIRLVLPYNK